MILIKFLAQLLHKANYMSYAIISKHQRGFFTCLIVSDTAVPLIHQGLYTEVTSGQHNIMREDTQKGKMEHSHKIIRIKNTCK